MEGSFDSFDGSTVLTAGNAQDRYAQDNPFDCAQDKKDLVNARSSFLLLFVGFWG
jgi:hypothetical protein